MPQILTTANLVIESKWYTYHSCDLIFRYYVVYRLTTSATGLRLGKKIANEVAHATLNETRALPFRSQTHWR